jgi:hypothetical protein
LEKVCKKCGEVKPLEEFVKNKTCKNGRAGICKQCSNAYSSKWKRENSERISKRRRERYAATEGLEVKKRERRRMEEYPLRVRCQMLRGGMKERAKKKNLEFDDGFFTVGYLMNRISRSSFCECCGKSLDYGFKFDKQKHDNSPSMDRVDSSGGYTKENVAVLCWLCNKRKQDSDENYLRMLADFMASWGNEV